MQIVAGMNVWPFEIEDVLSQHLSVSEAAVVSAFDERGASRLHAFVVPVGDVGRDALAEELAALSRARLTGYKVPRVFHVVDSLPRTPTGKLQRYRLRELAGDPAPSPGEVSSDAR